MHKPKIGEPRLCVSRIDVLYPGEMATAIVPLDGREHETQFLVEPTPGFVGWWLRLKWRVFWRWLPSRSQPCVQISVDAVVVDRE